MLWRRPPPARNTAPRIVKFQGVGDRQVRVVASDATPDRMGDILEPGGAVLANYRRNPIVLAQHDANQPIARCSSIGVSGGAIVALIEFPPAGTSGLADEYLRLMKAGVISAVSVGFLPIAWEPIRGAGVRYTSWEMAELSCVSVPANPSALVTERSLRRTASDETPPGNCGRPLDKECGLKDLADCATHGRGEIGFDGVDADLEQAKHLRLAQALRRKMDLRPELVTRTDRLRWVAELRAGHGIVPRVDPRVVCANALFRTVGRR